jgi:hypothetical protein
VVMIYQNLLTNTYGLFNSIRVNYKGLQVNQFHNSFFQRNTDFQNL